MQALLGESAWEAHGCPGTLVDWVTSGPSAQAQPRFCFTNVFSRTCNSFQRPSAFLPLIHPEAAWCSCSKTFTPGLPNRPGASRRCLCMPEYSSEGSTRSAIWAGIPLTSCPKKQTVINKHPREWDRTPGTRMAPPSPVRMRTRDKGRRSSFA